MFDCGCQQSLDDIKITNFHADQRRAGHAGPYRCIIIATSYTETVNVIELSSSDPLRSPAVSI